MNEKSKFVEPYKPSLIHTIYRWLDRLPGPYWLFSIIVFFVTGLLNLIVAWKEDVLAFGEINWYYATAGFFACYYFFTIDFLFRTAKDAVLDFLTILDVDENKSRLIFFEFIHLPSRPTAVFFILGAIIGLFLGIYLLPIAPELNRAFPELEVMTYVLGAGLAFVLFYTVLRASGLIGRLFEEKVDIDIFNQTSLYAISRYSAWLVAVIAISTYLQIILTPSLAETTAVFLTLMIPTWLIALIVFWHPLRGVNRKLELEKIRLLRNVNLRIRTNFDLLHSKIDNHEYKDISDIREIIAGLQAERENIKAISTWPWQTSTLTGLLTAILLPALTSILIELINKFINN